MLKPSYCNKAANSKMCVELLSFKYQQEISYTQKKWYEMQLTEKLLRSLPLNEGSKSVKLHYKEGVSWFQSSQHSLWLICKMTLNEFYLWKGSEIP